jgi:hypothetical protein
MVENVLLTLLDHDHCPLVQTHTSYARPNRAETRLEMINLSQPFPICSYVYRLDLYQGTYNLSRRPRPSQGLYLVCSKSSRAILVR